MTLRALCYNITAHAERRMAPTLRYSQSVYEDVLRAHVTADTRWLDLGCGHQLLPPWRVAEERTLAGRCRSLVGLDVDARSLQAHDSLSARVRGDITELPFKEDAFDLVTANMVVEHLDAPERQFREVRRILRPGARFIFHTPNARGYVTALARRVPARLKTRLIDWLEDRREEDVFETHYRANTAAQITALAATTGFDVVKLKMVASNPVFTVVPPLALAELVWIRLLLTERFKSLRTTIVAIWQKPACGAR